jgi:undecaprenyl diphosphate synthase
MNTSPSHSVQTIAEIIRENRLKHIAIIMDGNRRWAMQKKLPSFMGHQQGVNSVKDLVRYCNTLQLSTLTVYAFSTENWNRSKTEVSYLVRLFVKVLKKELDGLHQNNVRIQFIGNIIAFPQILQEVIEQARQTTASNTGLTFQIAANYGSRQELVYAMQAIARQVEAGELSCNDISEQTIQENLYTAQSGDPDLLIRTGGDLRISNYLLWQCAYAELYFTETLWPDFRIEALNAAIVEFAKRERRFGR